MQMAPARSPSLQPPQRKAMVLTPACAADSISKAISPTITTSSGATPRRRNAIAITSGAGFEWLPILLTVDAQVLSGGNSLHLSAEHLAQQHFGAMEVGFGRRLRHIQGMTNLRETQLSGVTQHNNRSELGRKFLNGFLQHTLEIMMFYQLIRKRAWIRHVPQEGKLAIAVLRLQQRELDSITAPSAQFIDATIAGDLK